ncbi:MAG: class B sortase [Gemmiger sp.]
MAGRRRYRHLKGESRYYPFGARTALRRRQKRYAITLRALGVLALLLAGALLVRQTVFRGGQPDAPVAGPYNGHGTVEVTISDSSILPQYRDLYAQNNDMVGWLCIPGTGIDYPVVQTPGDNEYYLRRGFDGLYAGGGTLFLDENCRLDPSPTDNWMIYGHNMRDGSMFAGLLNYADENFYAQYPTFTFDTLTREGTWRVLAAFYTTLGEDVLPYYTFFDAADETEWQTRYDAMLQKALYDTGCEAHYGDQLLTLSTCGETNSSTDKRFAVLAVRED